MPAQLQFETRTKSGSYLSQHPKRNSGDLIALDLRDHPARNVGDPSQILLPESASNAKRSKPAADDDIHRARVWLGPLTHWLVDALRRLRCGFCGRQLFRRVRSAG